MATLVFPNKLVIIILVTIYWTVRISSAFLCTGCKPSSWSLAAAAVGVEKV